MRAPFKPGDDAKKTSSVKQPKSKADYLKKQPLQTIQEAHKAKEFDQELYPHLSFLPTQILNLSRTPQNRSTYKTDQKQDDPSRQSSARRDTPTRMSGLAKQVRPMTSRGMASNTDLNIASSKSPRVQSALGAPKIRDSQQRMAALLNT